MRVAFPAPGRSPGDDRGSIAPLVAVLSLALLLLGGLVVDASRQLNARGRAVAYAEEAARAGAQAVDPATRDLDLDPGRVAERVASYCAAARTTDSQLVTCELTSVNGRAVTARARIELRAGLLGIVGATTLGADGEGTARSLVGLTEEDAW